MTVQGRPGQCNDARTFAIHPESAKERSEAEHKDADGEGERNFLYWHYDATILGNRVVSGLVEPRVCNHRFRRSVGQPLGER